MIWLAPWALAAGALGMLGVVAAHLLSRQRPRALSLATARFLPAGMLEATTIQRVPMDRWWMLLRLLILALLALGVAQPVRTGARVDVRTVLLLDRTLPADAQRRALSTLAPDDAVIAFDSLATLSAATLARVQVTRVASLSGALGKLVRMRDSLSRGARALQVTIASRFAPSALDAVAPRVRALVPDSITVSQVTAASEPMRVRAAPIVHADGDDPIRATVQLLGDSIAPAGSVVQRGASLAAQDSAAFSGGATVLWWPAAVAKGIPAMQALTVASATWIAPIAREAAPNPTGGTAVGWWADGSPAAWLERRGGGCLLHVRAALPLAGDQTLSLGAQSVLAALLTYCDDALPAAAPPPDWISPPPRVRDSSESGATRTSALAPWLVAAALALATLELLLRWRRAS